MIKADLQSFPRLENKSPGAYATELKFPLGILNWIGVSLSCFGVFKTAVLMTAPRCGEIAAS